MKNRSWRLRAFVTLTAALTTASPAYAVQQPPRSGSLEVAREQAATNPRDLEAQLSLAREALAAGEPQEAARAASAANAIAPSDGRALPLLAEAQARSGQLEAALATIESIPPQARQAANLEGFADAIRLSQQADPILQEAAASGSDADYRRAAKVLGEAVEAAPDLTQLRKSLGFLYLDKLRQPELALPQLEAAASIQPGDAETQSLLARALLELGQFARAETLYRGVVAAEPGSVYNRLNLAEALLGLDRRDEAERILAGVLADEPANDRAESLLAELRLAGASDLGGGQRGAAGESDLRTDEARRLLAAANDFVAAGDRAHSFAEYREAARLLRQALQIEPDSHTLRRTLGYVYLEKLGQPCLAYRELRRALAIKPGDLDTLKLYALATLRIGRTCEAIRLFELVLRRDPSDLWMRVNLGRAWAAAGEYDRAICIYNDVLARERGNFTARLGIAEVLTWEGYSDRPISIAQRLVREDPRSSEAHSLLGDLYRYDWDFDAAACEYRRAMANDPAGQAGREGLEQIAKAQSVYGSSDGYYFEDNFGFRRSFVGGGLRIPLSDKTYLLPRSVYWQFGQGPIELDRTDVSFDLEHHFDRHWQGTLRFLNYDYSNREDDQAGVASLQYTPNAYGDFYLSASANEPAFLTDINIPLFDIRMDNYSAGYDVDLADRWSTQGLFTYADYSDDNHRRFGRAALSFQPNECYDVFLRAKYEKLSFADQTPLYFSPDDFELLRLGTDFVLPLGGNWTAVGEAEGIDTLGEGWGHSYRIGPAYRVEGDVELRASYFNVSIPGAAPFTGDGGDFSASYRF